jgi:hypothetical protein
MLLKPSKRAISTYIKDYLQALIPIVEKRKSDILKTEIEPNFPLEFPVKAVVFYSKKGFVIDFEKAEAYSIIYAKERPSKWHQQGMFIFYRHFKHIKNSALKKAENDVKELLEFPSLLEAHDEELQREYEALEIQEKEYAIDSYISLLEKSNLAVSQTKDKACAYVYDVVCLRQKLLGNFQYFFLAGCRALNELYFLINLEIEASFFSALHGRYLQAMAGLRKVLEILIRALSLDSDPNKNVSQEILSYWLDDSFFGESFRDTVTIVIPKNIDERLAAIVNNPKIIKTNSYLNDLPNYYHDLCTFVHLSPKTYNLEIELIYPEYNEELFTNYIETLRSIIQTFEMLLIFHFPKIVQIDGLGKDKQRYELLILTKDQTQALIQLSSS